MKQSYMADINFMRKPENIEYGLWNDFIVKIKNTTDNIAVNLSSNIDYRKVGCHL